MRFLFALSPLLLIVPTVHAQIDPAMQAAQATQATMQVQQAQQAAMQASQQATQANQQAALNAMNSATAPSPLYAVAAPKFSLSSRTLSAPATIRLTDSTRGAIIFYTTDGWSPTVASQRYLGPIPISSNTTVQAVAIIPGLGRSYVATAQYILKNSPDSSNPPTPQPPTSALGEPIPAGGKLIVLSGTPVPLVFTSEITSRTATLGDQIPMALADDFILKGFLVARKGTPALGTVIQVEKNGARGQPGLISFQVDSFDFNSTPIKLIGSATREGAAKPPNAAVVVPLVGLFLLIKHGDEAVIPDGTPFTARIAMDTPLAPATH